MRSDLIGLALQAQRQLQKSLEAHGKYISSLIEKDRAAQSDPLDSNPARQAQALHSYQQPFQGSATSGDKSLCPGAAGPCKFTFYREMKC